MSGQLYQNYNNGYDNFCHQNISNNQQASLVNNCSNGFGGINGNIDFNNHNAGMNGFGSLLLITDPINSYGFIIFGSVTTGIASM